MAKGIRGEAIHELREFRLRRIQIPRRVLQLDDKLQQDHKVPRLQALSASLYNLERKLMMAQLFEIP